MEWGILNCFMEIGILNEFRLVQPLAPIYAAPLVQKII
jgi:hypothetical protein